MIRQSAVRSAHSGTGWASANRRKRCSLAASSASARFWAVMSTSKPPIWTMRPEASLTGKRITMLQA